MLKHYFLGVALSFCAPVLLNAQFSFTNATNLKSNTTTSGGCMGVVDMNGDGLDDMCILNNSRTFMVDYQNADGSFSLVNYGNVSNSGQWGMAIGDIDNNGHKDLVSGGSYDGTHFLRINSVGDADLTDLNNGNLFTQCVNIVDIDNDGHNDYWACHDDGAPRQWLNNGSGSLSYADIIDYTTTPTSDMSGNYGSVWTDFDNDGDIDLYIAHCRQNVNNANDPRRWNRLFVNDGNGNYTDRALDYGVQIRNQSWTADLGDIDNDGDLDMVVTNHDATIQLFENDGVGNFTEITAGSGLEITGFFLQSKFVDFDNDGFLDLLVAGGIERIWRNDGDNTFSVVSGVFPANKAMHSFATGDLNNDGFIDVFANYGSSYINADPNNPDRLWMNNGNDNHWFGVRLRGVESNRDAIGARVTITGPWGTQIREVRAGESYGMVTTFMCHFGLGDETSIPVMTIRWPSGLEETFTDLPVDQVINVVEGVCISPAASITTPVAPIVCGNGDAITLTANSDFSYLWSTGATTQTIEVTEPGSYSVTIDDGEGCTATTSIFVEQSPDETPSVTAVGETQFCEGGDVVLTASPSSAYTWSNGQTTQSITVESAGSYTVTVQGSCGAFTSDAITVDVLDGPDAPIADDVTIPVPGSATLLAVGDNIQWYDVPVGGTPIGSGNSFDTPSVATTTSFWVSATQGSAGVQAFGGPVNRATTGQFHPNTDFYPLFTANEAFTIKSVKVYASGAGNRTIALINAGNGSTVATSTIAIPDGESRVQLDFEVPAAGNYGLRCVGGNPQLWRDGLGSDPAYPFALGTFGTITSSSVSGTNATELYYFFYDWELQGPGYACEGPRTEVVVNVGSVGLDEQGANANTRIWPNPATDVVTIAFGKVEGKVVVDLLDVTGRVLLSRDSDSKAQAEGMMDLNVSGLAQGEYLVHVRSNAGSSVHRVMVR
jgi:hypothetical protein